MASAIVHLPSISQNTLTIATFRSLKASSCPYFTRESDSLRFFSSSAISVNCFLLEATSSDDKSVSGSTDILWRRSSVLVSM